MQVLYYRNINASTFGIGVDWREREREREREEGGNPQNVIRDIFVRNLFSRDRLERLKSEKLTFHRNSKFESLKVFHLRYLSDSFLSKKNKQLGAVSSCGSVVRVVTCDTKGPQFESSHIEHLFTDICIEKTIIQKREAGNGLFKTLKMYHCFSNIFLS